jgi:hypothetical protein
VKKLERELESAKGTIAAMETSKFWQMRKAWFQLKEWMGISDTNQI